MVAAMIHRLGTVGSAAILALVLAACGARSHSEPNLEIEATWAPTDRTHSPVVQSQDTPSEGSGDASESAPDDGSDLIAGLFHYDDDAQSGPDVDPSVSRVEVPPPVDVGSLPPHDASTPIVTLSDDDFIALVAENTAELQRCFQAEMLIHPAFQGAELLVEVHWTGQVTKVEVETDGSDDLSACLANEAYSWEFPAFNDEPATFTAPFSVR